MASGYFELDLSLYKIIHIEGWCMLLICLVISLVKVYVPLHWVSNKPQSSWMYHRAWPETLNGKYPMNVFEPLTT